MTYVGINLIVHSDRLRLLSLEIPDAWRAGDSCAQNNMISGHVSLRYGGRALVLRITPRERAVLQLIANGNETLEIAGRLGISEHEVEAGLTNLVAVMGARSRTEAVALALRRGLLAEEDERCRTSSLAASCREARS